MIVAALAAKHLALKPLLRTAAEAVVVAGAVVVLGTVAKDQAEKALGIKRN